MKRALLIAVSFFTLSPRLAQSHPGHGTPSDNAFLLIHHLAEPLHILPVLGAMTVLWMALRITAKRRQL